MFRKSNLARKQLVWACAFSFGTSVVGCKSRSFNSQVRAATNKSEPDVYVHTMPTSITPDMLKNWWKYGADWKPFSQQQIAAIELSKDELEDQFLQDNPKYPVTEFPPDDYASDPANTDAMKAATTDDGAGTVTFNPLKYIRMNVATKERNKEGTTPRPVAAKTMLMALRKIREMNYVVTPGTFADAKTNIKIFDSLKSCSTSSTMKDLPCKESKIASSGDVENNTLSVIPPHWAEIQGHYYSQTGHIIHGCYTTAIRLTAPKIVSFSDGTGFIPDHLQRRISLEMCLNAGEGKDAFAGWPERYKIPKSKLKELQGNAASLVTLGPIFKAFYDTQWVGVPDESGQIKPVNVFDYMMMSSVYSFNFKQQEAILNAYYIDSPYSSTATGNNTEEEVVEVDERQYQVAGPRKYVEIKSGKKGKAVSAQPLEKDVVSCHLFRPARTEDLQTDPKTQKAYNYCSLSKEIAPGYFGTFQGIGR